MTRVTLGKSRVRESRTPGSVRAKAEWLSYSTTTEHQKLRRQLATLELSDATAAEISAIRKHLANLDFVLKRLRD